MSIYKITPGPLPNAGYFGDDPDGVIRVPEWYKERQAEQNEQLLQMVADDIRQARAEAARRFEEMTRRDQADPARAGGELVRYEGTATQPSYNNEQKY